MYIISKQWLTVNEYFKWLQKPEVISLFQLQMPGYQECWLFSIKQNKAPKITKSFFG